MVGWFIFADPKWKADVSPLSLPKLSLGSCPAGSAFLLKVFNTLHPPPHTHKTHAHTVPFPRPRPLDPGWHLSLPIKISREGGVAG